MVLYSFDHVSSVRLPARLSGQTDCYGYFNGKPLNNATVLSIIPFSRPSYWLAWASQFNNLNIPEHVFVHNGGSEIVLMKYGRDLNPDYTYAQAGLLNKIVSGAGAIIKLEYGDHNLANVPDFYGPTNTCYYNFAEVVDENGGSPTGACASSFSSTCPDYHAPSDIQFPYANDGVCIKKIIYEDGFSADNTTVTEFSFSGGYRFFAGGYFWYGDIVDPSLNIIRKYYQSSFVTPMDLFNGSNHGYSFVDVNITGFGGSIISHKKHEFTNIITKSNEKTMGFDFVGLSRLKLRAGRLTHTFSRKSFQKQYLGLIKNVTEYAPNSSASIKISETNYVYNEIRYVDSLRLGNNFNYQSPAVAFLNNQYSVPLSKILLTNENTTRYFGGSTLQVDHQYYYDTTYNDLEVATTVNSKGELIEDINGYWTDILKHNYTGIPSGYIAPANYPDINVPVRVLTSRTHKVNHLITEYSNLVPSSSTITTKFDNYGIIIPASSWGINITGGLRSTKFDKVYSFFSKTPYSGSTIPTVMAKHFRKYDDHNNVLETGYNNDQKFGSAIWDNRIGQKVAEVSNAKYNDIAYSSFEGSFEAMGTADYNKGNWDFNSGNIITSSATNHALTGRYYLTLPGSVTTSSYSTTLSTAHIKTTIIPANGKKYFFSFWFRGMHPMISSPLAGTFTDQITVGGWTLTTAVITGDGANPLGIYCPATTAGTSIDIDEIRLIPVEASMETFTYEPLLGISSHCDERNKVTYFEYDAMGRQTMVKDIEGNIISLQKHVVQGSDY